MSKTKVSFFAIAFTGLVLGISCATRETSAPPSTPSETSTAPGVAIPGFESLGSPRARRKADIIALYGAPAKEETVASRYSVLTYPVSGWNENLLILFAGEEMLAFCRESAKAVLDSTIQHHARTADGSVVLFQSWANGKTSYFKTGADQLEKAPRRRSDSSLPLSEGRALELAREWVKANKPGSTIQPVIRGTHDVPRLPGAAFYVAAIHDFEASTMENLVILMDGTIIPGETDEKP